MGQKPRQRCAIPARAGASTTGAKRQKAAKRHPRARGREGAPPTPPATPETAGRIASIGAGLDAPRVSGVLALL